MIIIRRIDKTNVDYGRELFTLWVRLGTMRAAMNFYNLHPLSGQKLSSLYGVQYQIRKFILARPDEVIEIWQKYDPGKSEEDIRNTIVYYSLRFYKSAASWVQWAKKNPWVIEYEKDAKIWYGEPRLLS